MLIALPTGNEVRLHDSILESENIFDITKFLPQKQTTPSTNPVVDTGILQEIQDNYEMHWAAEDWWAKYDKICSNRSSLCDKISYVDISDKDKYFYQWIINLIVSKLDNYSALAVSDTIKNIQVDWSNSERRWYAGRTKIYMNPKDIKSYREFMEVLTHELGHIVDLWVVVWTNQNNLDTNYTEFWQASFYLDDPSLNFYKISRANENTTYKQTSYKDFVSGYGMSNIYEDFAECNNMYINHQDLFAKMAENSTQLKAKFAYIQSLYKNNYLQNDSKNLTKIAQNTSRRPRDTTRIK